MNEYPLIIDGKPHTAYALFFRTHGSVLPEELIKELGLTNYRKESAVIGFQKHIVAIDDGSWIHLCADYSYDYWYDPEVLLSTRIIATRYDTLILTFPDTDDSYEIEYWKDGVLNRRVFFEDTSVWKKTLNLRAKNLGEKLPAESHIKNGEDPVEGLWLVAESLGISTNYESSKIDLFVDKSPLERKNFSIAEARHGRGIIQE